MGHPSVHERLKIISEIRASQGDIREYLDLLEKVLQAQLHIDETSNKGGKRVGRKLQSIVSLEQRALEAKKPLIHFLQPERFDVNALQPVFHAIVQVFLSTYPERKGLQTLLDHLDRGTVDLLRWVKAVFTEEEAFLIQLAEKYGVEPSLLFFMITAPLQPFFEDLTRQASSPFFDRWWQARCPVCGQIPRIAHLRDRQRYLACTYCGAEYRSDYFLCVNCENKDPYTQKYLQMDDTPGFQIDFCTKCRHYLKVIIDQALPDPIPGFLVDLLTLNLDVQAKHADLVRRG